MQVHSLCPGARSFPAVNAAVRQQPARCARPPAPRAAPGTTSAATSCARSSVSRSRWLCGILIAVLRLRAPACRPARPACRTASGNVILSCSFDELEDVAPGAAAEAVKEALVAVHVERRRLLAVKRAQPFPRRAAALQRHALLDDLHDVGVRLQVLDEVRRGKSAHTYSFNSTTVTPPPPCSGGADANSRRSMWSCRYSAIARRSCPVPYPWINRTLRSSATSASSRKLLGARQRLVHVAADHVQLGERPLARLQLDVDAHPGGLGRRRCLPARAPAARRPARAAACRARRLPPRVRAAPGRSPSSPSAPTARDRQSPEPAREFGRTVAAAALAGLSRCIIAPQPLANRIDRRARLGSRRTRFARRDDEPRRRAALGFSRHARRSGPSARSTTASISRRASRSRSSIRSSSRRRNVSSRLRSSCSRACILRRFFRERCALARGQPRVSCSSDCMSRSTLARCSASWASRSLRWRRAVSMIDAGKPEPRRNLEREAAAGSAVVQAIRRRERCRIEPEAGRRHALRRHGVRLQRVVVRRRDDHRAALPEMIDHRHRQRAALVGIGAAAGLVEQHERRQRQRAVHRDDVGDVPGEGAEAGRDRLLVADVGEHRAEYRHLRAVGRRNRAGPSAP